MRNNSSSGSGVLVVLALGLLVAGCEASPGDPTDSALDAGTPPTDMNLPSSDRQPDLTNADANPRTDHQDATSCGVDAPTACPATPPRYGDVEPIFRQRCVTCHSGVPDGPWPLDSYGHIADWQNEIRDELLRCTMPPLDASVQITPEEKAMILTWLRCGLPR